MSHPVSNPVRQVVDSSTERRLGHLQIEIKDLLREPELQVHDAPYQLKDSGPVSKIILSAQLRVRAPRAALVHCGCVRWPLPLRTC